MLSDGIIEAINIFPNSPDGLLARLERGSPDEFLFDRLENGFDHGVMVAVSLAAHRRKDAMGVEKFAVVVTSPYR